MSVSETSYEGGNRWWALFNNLSLRYKLSIAFFFSAMLSLSAVVFSTAAFTSRNQVRVASESLTEIAQSNALTIGNFLIREVDLLIALSNNQTLQDELIMVNAGNMGRLSELRTLDAEWREADANNDNSNPLVAQVLTHPISEELGQFQGSFTEHVEIFVTDSLGFNVASTNRTSDFEQSDEAWWQAAYDSGQGAIFIGQPAFDESANAQSIIIAIPIYERNSTNVVGILRTTIAIDRSLNTILANGQFGDTGRVDIQLPTNELMVLDENQSLTIIPNDTNALAINRSDSGTQFIEGLYNNLPYFFSVSELTSNQQDTQSVIELLEWQVVVRQERSEALIVTNDAVEFAINASLLTVLATAVIAVVLAQFLTRPLEALTTVARQIGQGQLNARANTGSHDEVGMLAQTFNETASQLQDTLGNLEEKVVQRTRDLSIAAELGQSFSQIRDLDRLLSETVSRIQDAYNLYHVQIYLLVGDGRTLVLQASSGEIGRQLLQQNHRLAVGLDSINGTSALMKEALVVTDTGESRIFRPNVLLPETRSEMAVPMLIQEQVIGILNLQSGKSDDLTQESLPVFEVIAGQLAVAIETATQFELLQERETTQQTQLRQTVREGWDAYLDAIARNEQIVFDATDSSNGDSTPTHITTPIVIAGEMIGEIELGYGAESAWTTEDAEFVAKVAEQVAQQVENLRLLAETERYRTTAEDAMKRLTREGWEGYLVGESSAGLMFTYDGQRVQARQASIGAPAGEGISQPISILGEEIGDIFVERPAQEAESTNNLVATISARLSEHLENLRLTARTEQALTEAEKRGSELEILNSIGDIASSYLDLNAMLGAVGSYLQKTFRAESVYVAFYDQAQESIHFPYWFSMSDGQLTLPDRPMRNGGLTGKIIRTRQPLLVSSEEEANQHDVIMVGTGRYEDSYLGVPIIIGDEVIGVLAITSYIENNVFSDEDARLFTTIATSIGVSIQNIRQFTLTQKRARREQVVNEIAQKIQRTQTVESALKTTIQALGSALQSRYTTAQLNTAKAPETNGSKEIEE